MDIIPTEFTGRMLYAVMKAKTSVECTLFNGHKENVDLVGVAGYTPLYATYKEAEEASCEGKYQIMVLQVPAETPKPTADEQEEE